MHRMNQERLPRRILEWRPPGRQKGRPRYSWMQVTTEMRETAIGDLEWVDREGGRERK